MKDINPALKKIARIKYLSIHKPINDEFANWILSGLDELDNEANSEILICIHSEGGKIDKSLQIVNRMKKCKSPIKTYNYNCSGTAIHICAAGYKGKRYSLKGSLMSFTFGIMFSNNLESDEAKKLQEIFISRTKITHKKYKRLFDNEKKLSSFWQKRFGIVDNLFKIP